MILEKIKQLYNNNEYEIKEDNTLFIIKDIQYTINEDFLKELYQK